MIKLTIEGLDKFKLELLSILTERLPKAQQDFDEVRTVWGTEDPPYHDARAKRNFYYERSVYLKRVIDNVVWNEEKGYYKSSGEDTQ